MRTSDDQYNQNEPDDPYADSDDEDNSPNSNVAVINRRDMQIKSFFSNIITFQRRQIRKVSKKNDILIAIACALAIIALGCLSSSYQCAANNEKDVQQFQRFCLSQHNLYKCGSKEKKDPLDSKICEQMAQCLKDPLGYKLKKDEQKWNEIIDEILYYFNLTRSNSLYIGVLFVVFSIIKYLKIK